MVACRLYQQADAEEAIQPQAALNAMQTRDNMVRGGGSQDDLDYASEAAEAGKSHTGCHHPVDDAEYVEELMQVGLEVIMLW
jgi:hypothetical protein